MISKQLPPVDHKIIGKDTSKTKPIWIDIHGKLTDKPISEQYKDIEGYEGLYAVTNFGNVYSYKSNRFLKGRNNGKGYLQVQLFKQGKGKQFYIHRLVAQTFLPNIFPLIDWDVDHINNVRDDNRVTNLQYVTRFDNILLKDNRGEITMEDLEKRLERKSRSYQTSVDAHNRIYEENLDLKAKIIELEYELKLFKRENSYVMEACKDYVVIPVDEYEELQDVYQKLSETEEQRKNMSQAYEDEYQTRLVLQEENKKLKDKIKRNLNPYGGIL